MRLHHALFTVLLAASIGAQSNTLPRGWDTIDGADSYDTTTNSYFWIPFELGASSLDDYNPAKVLYAYDSSLFPWDPRQAKVITKMTLSVSPTSSTSG